MPSPLEDGGTYLLHILNALCAGGAKHEFWVILVSRQRPLLKSLPPQAHAVVCASVPQRAWCRSLRSTDTLGVTRYRR